MARQSTKKTETNQESKIEEVKKVETSNNLDINELKKMLMAEMKADLEKQVRQEMAKEQEELKEEIKSKEKTLRTYNEVNLNRLVPVRSITNGELGLQTKYELYVFSNYGDVHEISIGELKALKASKPIYFTAPWIIIDDEETAEICKVSKLYNDIAFIDDLTSFFTNNTEEVIIKKLKETPYYLRLEIFNTLKQMWESKEFRDYDVVELIKDHFKVNIIDK